MPRVTRPARAPPPDGRHPPAAALESLRTHPWALAPGHAARCMRGAGCKARDSADLYNKGQ
ncbi:hypothetical protein DEIGR_102026 [Deinococcus grandis]|uniref:Uncharacterized protein n=1 Tax=Deinococcus grandis TaxID=57498 RepID=A0A100HJP4_9DEIO|nr:hypothetical protein DEGR_12350 [Deinococcus grandis]GAQ21999.1 hypothetical protein DEIGR_102026 [Deinococcus grandis]GGB75773.1 hypothetical protein GCM10008019_34980 [Deinococcus soli (ex Cha et al. 2016)]